MSGYADAAGSYRSAGWSCVLPLPPGRKSPPPTGWTGRGGRVPDDAQVERWCREFPDGNVALRPGRAVIGIDLDLYKEPGARTGLEALAGPLPPTWVSTARDGGSGIYWYRVAPPPRGRRWKSNPVPGCEVIQHGHRYGVVWPSKHPEGLAYLWLEHGAVVNGGHVPEPAELPELPPAAQTALLEPDRRGETRAPIDLKLTDGDPDEHVATRRDEALAALAGGGASRHDTVRDAVAALVRMAEGGHPGVGPTLDELRGAFIDAVADDRTGRPEAEAEWERMVRGGMELIASTESTAPRPADGGHGIKLMTATDLFAIERHEPDWLHEPLFERGRLTAVVGAAKSGKSLLVQEIACALASGRRALGQPPGPGATVLYLDDENTPVDWAARLRAFGYEPGDQLPGLQLASFPSLALTEQRDAQRLQALAADLRPDLVVLDTASRFVRGNENDAETWQTLYRESLVHLKAMGCAIVRIDHLGKDETRGARGSSAKNEDVDSVWNLRSDPEGAWLWLDRTHTRQGYGASSLTLRRRRDPLRHEPVGPGEAPPASAARVAELSAVLDRLGVPATAGRPTAGRTLREEGVEFANQDLAEAIRARKGGGVLPGMEDF